MIIRCVDIETTGLAARHHLKLRANPSKAA